MCCQGTDVPLPVTELELELPFEDPDVVLPPNMLLKQRRPVCQAPGPSGTFTVVISTKGFSTLGLEVELIQESVPMIVKVKEGPIQKFNQQAHNTSKIRPYDFLLALDGVQSWDLIQEKMFGKLPDRIFMTLNRARKIQIVLEKTGPLGLTLAYTNTSHGALVTNIEDVGSIVDWNANRTSDPVRIGDHVLEFNGRVYMGNQLSQILKDEKVRTLTVLKYIQADMSILMGLSRQSFVWMGSFLKWWYLDC